MWTAPEDPQLLSIAAQRSRMHALWPSFLCTWSQGQIRWRGSLRPTSLSPAYKLRIVYRLGISPRVSVLAPTLKLHPNHVALPHYYRQGWMCLFDPELRQWDATLSIAETTIPWAAVWLYHYETWLCTGTWEATESHPSRRRALRDGLAA